MPDVWFEQTTYRLQGDCTTTVLIRQYTTESFLRFQLQVECFLVAEPILKTGRGVGSRTQSSDFKDRCANTNVHYAPTNLAGQVGIEPTTS